MFRQQGNPLKNIVSGCVVRSEHRIDILNGKSIGKEQLNVFITAIYRKDGFFLGVSEEVQNEPAEVVYAGLQTCNFIKRDSNTGVFL